MRCYFLLIVFLQDFVKSQTNTRIFFKNEERDKLSCDASCSFSLSCVPELIVLNESVPGTTRTFGRTLYANKPGLFVVLCYLTDIIHGGSLDVWTIRTFKSIKTRSSSNKDCKSPGKTCLGIVAMDTVGGDERPFLNPESTEFMDESGQHELICTITYPLYAPQDMRLLRRMKNGSMTQISIHLLNMSVTLIEHKNIIKLTYRYQLTSDSGDIFECFVIDRHSKVFRSLLVITSKKEPDKHEEQIVESNSQTTKSYFVTRSISGEYLEEEHSTEVNHHFTITTESKPYLMEKPFKNIYTYSTELKNLIGKPLEDEPELGPLLSLDNSGVCSFQASQYHGNSSQVNKLWGRIAAGHAGVHDYIDSKVMILPNYWGGLVGQIELKSRNRQSASVRFWAPDVNQNKFVKLPLSIKLQIEMKLTNKEKFVSKVQIFKVKKIGGWAENKDFITIPLLKADTLSLPQIYLKFIE